MHSSKMDEPIIIGFIQNIAVLLAFAMVYENFWLRDEIPFSLTSKILTGLVLGGISIVLLYTTWTLTPGLVFDTRSVMLAISGLFFGAIPTIIAMVIAGAVRFVMGGEGMWMGITVILMSGSVGILWGRLRKNKQHNDLRIEYLKLGIVVHLLMLASTVFLPSERIIPTLRIVSLPVMLIHAPGTMLLGLILAAQKNNFHNRRVKDKLFSASQKLSKELLNNQKMLQEQIDKYQELTTVYLAQNAELIKSMGKAEESDRLKSAFLANMSHEIRTPMNAIVGFSDLLEMDNLSQEKRQKYAAIIRKSGNYLLSIISDIVEISHIEAGQVEKKESKVDMEALIDELYHTCRLNLPADKNISIRIVKPELPFNDHMMTDDVKLKQILINLLNNAIKFTVSGEISFGYYFEKGNEIIFFVKDTGIGIAPENQQIIFERFRQLENNLPHMNAGSGLGLSISKAYVELLGGNIEVYSESGKGSEFRVKLPFLFAKEKTQVEDIDKDKNNSIHPDESIILVAEDEDINWFYLNQVLKKHNYNSIRAENGKRAVELCRENNEIGLVLMDIKMPVMNGFEALHEMKKEKPGLPVIAQTAYALPHDIAKMKAVFDDYITKPINKELLMLKIEGARKSRSNLIA
jgi:signal transduction histidine kinase/ActR/RegA family two-component response regulator